MRYLIIGLGIYGSNLATDLTDMGHEVIGADHNPTLVEQVKDKMKDMILNGILKENDQLPSVRELSMQLTLNPNTIQKAYKDLETEGYIYSVKGKGNFVARVSTINRNEKCTALYRQMKELVRELIFIGETREQITSQMEAFF